MTRQANSYVGLIERHTDFWVPFDERRFKGNKSIGTGKGKYDYNIKFRISLTSTVVNKVIRVSDFH